MTGMQPWQHEFTVVLDRLVRDRRDHPALIDSEGARTFGQLHRTAHRKACDLDDCRGLLRPVTARSDADFFVEVFAIWLAGGIPLPLPARGAAMPAEAFSLAPGAGCEPWKAVVGVHDGLYRPLVTHGERPSVPRKALALGMHPDGRVMISSPLHLNGPFEFAVRQLLLGGTVVICPVFTPEVWVTYVGRHRPTWVFLVPTQLRRLLDSISETTLARATSSVNRLLHSSQPCPPDLRSRLLAVLDAERVARSTTAPPSTTARSMSEPLMVAFRSTVSRCGSLDRTGRRSPRGRSARSRHGAAWDSPATPYPGHARCPMPGRPSATKAISTAPAGCISPLSPCPDG